MSDAGADAAQSRSEQHWIAWGSRGAVRLAVVSLWEAQMLHAKGRLILDRACDVWIRDAAAVGVIESVPLDVQVVVALADLPVTFHGDPADRLIVAMACAHRFRLATHDRAVRRSQLTTLWAAR